MRGGPFESCTRATCGMCSERPPAQTLLTLSLPACPPLYSSQTLALQPAESCSSKVDLHHHHTSHVTRHKHVRLSQDTTEQKGDSPIKRALSLIGRAAIWTCVKQYRILVQLRS